MKSRKQIYRRRSITTSVIAFLLISSALFGIYLLGPTPLASPATTMYVDPPSIIDPTLTPPKTFTVKLMVSDVEDLSSWQVFMTFNGSVVKATLITQGDFLTGPEGTMWSSKIFASYVMFGAAQKGKNETTGEPYPGVSGSGWLGSVKFEVKATGSTVLNITNPPYTFLQMWTETPPYELVDIPCEMQNGYFSNTVVTYTLTVHSDPISGIDFTVDGTTHTTPWSGSLSAGSHTIVMPSTWTVGTNVYNFDHWEDSSTDRTRVITLTAAKTITAYYVLAPKYWTLTVKSDPISGVEFTLDGVKHSTTYSESLIEGSHTIIMPSTWTVGANVYNFDHWEDASTSPSRTISLTSDKTVTAYYVYVPETYTLTVLSDPITGVSFTVDGTSHTTPWSGSLPKGSHTIVMPSSWGKYNFDHWEDSSTSRTRTISLTADKTITAYFVKRRWTLNINSDPFTGVEFTLNGTPHTTPWSSLLDEGSYTIVMPSTWTVGLDLYSFDHWEDTSTIPTRTISLTAAKTITAYYKLALERYKLVIGVVGSGTTIPSPDTYILDAGTKVTVAAIPDPSWMMDHWELDGINVGDSDPYTVTMNTNHTLVAHFLKTHKLTVNSTPISGIQFTLDGVTKTTPYSGNLSEGSHTIVMPSKWTVGADVYNFDHWEDTSTNPTRTISLTADKTITAYYVLAPKYWTLTVKSDPISGVEFTLDGVKHSTTYSASLIEGSHTIVMPSTWTVGADVYQFDHWEDSSTSPSRTISLTSDKTITAYYKYIPKTYTLTVHSDPISGIDFTVNGTPHTTPWSGSLTEGTYTIVVPSTWTVGSDVYNFDHWEDTSTSPTRVVTLTADKTITAHYVLAPKYWTLTVNSAPISGVEFTLDGVPHTTSYSDSLLEGSHTIIMPPTWTAGADIYNFDHWEDTSTNPTRTVSLTSHTTVTAYYTLAPVAETVVAVDPPTSTANPGEYFTIKINITNVTDLYSWAFKLKWQTGLLECRKENIIEGPFLKAGGSTVFTKKAYTSYIDVGCMLLMAPEGVSGSGTLATATFKVLKTGNCTLELYDVTLLNSSYLEIPHAILHGYFYTTHPVASYMYSPHPMEEYGRPIVDEPVTFNATTSYDPDQPHRGQTGIGISLYEWDFNGDGTYDHSTTDPCATHIYDTAGDYRVILRVTDDDGETATVNQPIIGTTIRVQLHDIAVINVTVTPTVFVPGTTVTINVTVLNKGSVTEALNVTVYKDSDPVKTVRFIHDGKLTLMPGEDGTTTIEWDTTGLALGTYLIKVYAFLINPATLEAVPSIEREEVLFDNWMTYGTITVVRPDFELTASPTSLSIMQGGSDTSTITITSLYDFSDLVSLSVSGVPSGVTVTLDPKDVTPPPNEAATSTLTVSVGVTATPGSHILTVTATSGTLEHSTDITLEITKLPPIQYQLTIEVVGSGTTDPLPGIHTYDEGTKVVVDALPDAGWMLDHWELDGVDVGDTDPYTVTMNTNHTLVAFFVEIPPTHKLTVKSDPISGVEFTLDGVKHTTPHSESLLEGSHTIVMPPTWTVGTDVYNFDHWEDLSTTPTRTVSLTADMTVTAYYVLAPKYWTLTVYSAPISGVQFTLDGIFKTTPYSDSVLQGSHTIVMPPTWTVGADVYQFDHWEDASTNPTRTISLISDKTVTAYYKYVPKTYKLTVNSDPITGVKFTIDGNVHATPWSESLPEGTYTILMPSTWGIYDFDHWEDASTSPTRTISLTADKTVTAYYVKRQWTLTVKSEPISDVQFTIDGITHLTPWSSILDEGTYTIVMPSKWTVGANIYNFDHWEDTSKNPTRVITLTADKTVTAYYVLPTGDVTPPTITINEPTARDYLHSEVITLDFSAVDTESGVASISAKLNQMTVESGDTIELFTLSLGTHTLTVTAVDNAGNSATKTVEFNIVATIDSLIGLVEKFYELGYIDKKDVKLGLLDKLYAAKMKIEASQTKVAENILNAFINQLKAQCGKRVSEYAANILIADAQYVIRTLFEKGSSKIIGNMKLVAVLLSGRIRYI